METTETHEFKRGQKLRLDDIFHLHGLAGGKWWMAADYLDNDAVTITEDITIIITAIRKG